jgi:hypothetical protein
MSEWYDYCAEDEAGLQASYPPVTGRNTSGSLEKARQEETTRQQLINTLLTRLYERFPQLATRFQTEIARVETLDLLRRLSITLALARNEATARRAILAIIPHPLGTCPQTDCRAFLSEEYA